ncbi:unnamed protein product [Symbiodinium sp. CCMP2592]|nr:unnamed protein product [Symbiodinium sp. CCMP2592]
MSRRRRGGGVPPVPLPSLIDGSSSNEPNFTSALENLDEYICFAVYGDRGEDLGHAIGQIRQRFEKDSEGAYLQLAYLGCSDEYYQWYVKQEGKRDGLPADCYHHLCRRHVTRCSRAVGGSDVIHVQKWSPVTKQEAHDILTAWGFPGLPADPTPAHAHQTAPKRKAKRSTAMQALPAAKAEEGEEDFEDDEGGAEPETRPPLKRYRKRHQSGKEGIRGAVLDAMLDEDIEVNSPRGPSRKIEDRLDALRAKLQGKQAEAKGNKSAGAVLAARAAESSQKPRKKRKSGANVIRQLRKALQLRKLAEDKPGKLLLTTLQGLHEQLGAATGEASDDPLSPIMVRYLLTMVMPSFPSKLGGSEKYRELRTLCQALDCLLRGKVDSAGDILVQRFKSLVMGLRDGTERFGHYLELIPEESLGVTSDEAFYARELAGLRGEHGQANPAPYRDPSPHKAESAPQHQTLAPSPRNSPSRPPLLRKRDTPTKKEDRQGEDRRDNHGTRRGQGSDTEEKRRESQSMERPDIQDSAGAAVSSCVEVDPGGCRGIPGDSPRFFNQGGCDDRACTAQSGGSGSASTQLAVERLLQLLHVDDGSDARPRMLALLSQGLPETQHVLQMGITALQLLFLSPRDGQLIQTSLRSMTKKSVTPIARQRDLLPLPLPPIGAAIQVLAHCSKTSAGMLFWNPTNEHKRHKQKLSKIVGAGCMQLWRLLVVVVLNGEACGWNSPLFPPVNNAGTAAQRAALRHLTELVDHFCRCPLELREGKSFEDIVRSKGLDYAGEEVLRALPVRLGEIAPGLPADGVAGSLEATTVAAGRVKSWLTDPSLCLLPQDQWPDPLPKASMNCTREDWLEIARVLVAKNIMEPIKREEIFRVRGELLLNGIFAVEKKGVPAPGETKITRLIMNCVPSNSIQRLMEGDLPTLSSSSQWTAAYLHPSQVLLWSGDDQRGAFYAWRLPRAWRRYLAFRWPVPGHVVGLPSESEVYLSSAVIPMGWLNAVSLFQHLHRQLGLSPPPAGAGLPAENEWRRDRPVPASATSLNGGWIQYYLDDFDAPEYVGREQWQRLRGVLSSTHRRQRGAYSRQGVAISEDKSHVRELSVNRMGAHVDGDKGFVSVPLQKLLEVGWMCIWTLGERSMCDKPLLMLLGRLVRCFEFRRPLMGLLNEVWPKGKWFLRRSLKAPAVRELLRGLSCLPLAVSSLRTEPSGLVTCSDASLDGAGLCASAGLTQEGKTLLDNLEGGDAPAFRPTGALEFNRGDGPRVLVVSLFDSVGAVICALTRLPCQVIGYASSSIDKKCKRLLRRRWPGVIELGNIENIDSKCIEHLHKSVNHRLDVVIVGAGCPCQAIAEHGQHSQLFFHVLRVIQLFKHVFEVPVHSFVENTFSITTESRQKFSNILETEPLLLDAKWLSWCERPRLFWCSWDVQPVDGEALIDRGDYRELKLPLTRGDPSEWLDAGCVWNGKNHGWLPALTRPKPRKTRPRDPDGLAGASDDAVARWEQDQYRLQVCNYESDVMVRGVDGALRLPSPSERETLMGFDRGYLSKAVSPKLSHDEALDLVGHMVGNSFHVHVVVVLLHSLLVNFGVAADRDLVRLRASQGDASAGWLLHPKFVARNVETYDTAKLVLHFMRQAERGGTDVRLDARSKLTLKSQMVSGGMQARYRKAVLVLLSFLVESRIQVTAWHDLDEAVSAWLEFAYSEGESKSLASDALAGVHYFLPPAVGMLKHSWKLAKIWHRLEPPLRVLPLSPMLVFGFAGAAVGMGFIHEAAGIMIAFDAMLRSGELYALKVGDVKFMRERAVLNLHQSKAGKRTGHSEMVVVESRMAFKWLKRACLNRPKAALLIERGAGFFRKLFHSLLSFFKTEGLINVYSLRRGGATWDFLHHQSMERTLLRGRWASTSTARIYLQDAAATVNHLSLTPDQRHLANSMLQKLKS